MDGIDGLSTADSIEFVIHPVVQVPQNLRYRVWICGVPAAREFRGYIRDTSNRVYVRSLAMQEFDHKTVAGFLSHFCRLHRAECERFGQRMHRLIVFHLARYEPGMTYQFFRKTG